MCFNVVKAQSDYIVQEIKYWKYLNNLTIARFGRGGNMTGVCVSVCHRGNALWPDSQIKLTPWPPNISSLKWLNHLKAYIVQVFCKSVCHRGDQLIISSFSSSIKKKHFKELNFLHFIELYFFIIPNSCSIVGDGVPLSLSMIMSSIVHLMMLLLLHIINHS